MVWKSLKALIVLCWLLVPASLASAAQIDNSVLSQAEFREHKTTYGLVFRLPDEVVAQLTTTVGIPLRAELLRLGLKAEASTFNIPHVTSVHIHSVDPATPKKMLDAVRTVKLPPVLTGVVLQKFYTTEAAKGAGRPWWFDLGIIKTGKAYEDMMAFNTRVVPALAPLRDGPLPRVTGPVYAKMGAAGKELVQTVGVSGVNVVKDGKELLSHNPHNTLVYSMAPFSPEVKNAMDAFAATCNTILPEGITTTFSTVSIVELAFSGNVIREIYRIDLASGEAVDAANGQIVK